MNEEKRLKNPLTCPSKTDEPEESSDTPSLTTSSLEESFSMVKLNLSSLESDFVSFKQDTTKTIREMSKALECKDSQIISLNERIASLESTQLLNDSTQTCGYLEKKINNLTKPLNNLKEISNQQIKSTPVTNFSTTNTEIIHVASSSEYPSLAKKSQDDKPIYSIPTSNQFDVLNTNV